MRIRKQINKDQIQVLVNKGYTSKEIAKNLDIPESTLKEGIKKLNINLRKRPRSIVEFVDPIKIEYPKEGEIIKDQKYEQRLLKRRRLNQRRVKV